MIVAFGYNPRLIVVDQHNMPSSPAKAGDPAITMGVREYWMARLRGP
jgi:hypothetical protein